MLRKCVYYRLKHGENGGPLKLYFDGLGMRKWNKPMDRLQTADKKNVFICLVIMFISRVMFIRMSNNDSFFIFCWPLPKISHNSGTQFKCTWKISLSEHDLEKWAHFFYLLFELFSRLFQQSKGIHTIFPKKEQKIVKKGQNRAKALKIWTKMHKM